MSSFTKVSCESTGAPLATYYTFLVAFPLLVLLSLWHTLDMCPLVLHWYDLANIQITDMLEENKADTSSWSDMDIYL